MFHTFQTHALLSFSLILVSSSSCQRCPKVTCKTRIFDHMTLQIYSRQSWVLQSSLSVAVHSYIFH